MKIFATLVLAGALCPLPAPLAAQEVKPFKPSANPMVDAVRDALTRDSKKLIAAAELMPAEKYSFHPTPAQMTFGKLMAHVAQTNGGICTGLGGTNPPDFKNLAETDGKEKLVAAVKQSFDFCAQALGSLTDAQLGTEWATAERKSGMSRASAVVIIAADWADHYSTAAAYLRANDILPPTAQPKKEAPTK